MQPKAKSLMVHQVLRRHWQQVLVYNFPEQYEKALQLVTSSSEAQRCSLATWCDLINSLGQNMLHFVPESTTLQQFQLQVLQYTTQQTMLDIHHVTTHNFIFN